MSKNNGPQSALSPSDVLALQAAREFRFRGDRRALDLAAETFVPDPAQRDGWCKAMIELEPDFPDLPAVTKDDATKSGPVITCFASIEARPISWLWPGRIPLGRITLLVGRPGEGKSFLTTDLAARVSQGRNFPDGSPCPQGSVILISAEDDPGDTIRPRLDAHGADVNKVHLLSAVRRTGEDGKPQEIMFTLADVGDLELALQAHPDCRLIVVDPIGSFMGGKVDAHRDNEVRSVLAPVARLAERYGPAVLIVAHRRKAGGDHADDLALGSRGFVGIARAVWHLSRDPQDKSRRLLLPGKFNLAREPDGLAFTIMGDPPVVAWEAGTVAMHADDALAIENRGDDDSKPGPEAEARERAEIWLRETLADGPRLAKELTDEWVNGQGGSQETLKRARHAIGVASGRPINPGPWWWRLVTGAQGQPDNAGPGSGEPDHLDLVPQNNWFADGQDGHKLKLFAPDIVGGHGNGQGGAT